MFLSPVILNFGPPRPMPPGRAPNDLGADRLSRLSRLSRSRGGLSENDLGAGRSSLARPDFIDISTALRTIAPIGISIPNSCSCDFCQPVKKAYCSALNSTDIVFTDDVSVVFSVFSIICPPRHCRTNCRTECAPGRNITTFRTDGKLISAFRMKFRET